MTDNRLRYVVISPVKNEEQFIVTTIASMVFQKTLPAVWIIVDDASTDTTAALIKEYANKYPWIQYLRHPGIATRKTGSAEVHAFNYGYALVKNQPFDFIVKLDGDLSFDDDYFEKLLSWFSHNSKLGIASGIYLEKAGTDWVPVIMPGYHAAGASKVVRRECFEQIHGFITERGWDTIDEIRAHALGWETRHFSDIHFYHLRKEGAGMGSLPTNVMHGEIFYRTGGSLVFFIVKVCIRMLRGKPFFLAGAAMVYGYLAAKLRKKELLVSAVEAQAYNKLLFRRMRAGFSWIRPTRS